MRLITGMGFSNKQAEQSLMIKYICGIFSVCFIYSNLRYVVFGNETIDHIPLFIMNKTLSWSGLAVIGLSRLFKQPETRRKTGLMGAIMIGMHVVISMIVLRPEYLGKFFNDLDKMRMTWNGEAAILFGVIGLVFLSCILWETINGTRESSNPTIARSVLPWAGKAVLICGAFHVTFMGWNDWIEPAKWADNGYLPPISMLSFFTAVILIFVSRARRN